MPMFSGLLPVGIGTCVPRRLRSREFAGLMTPSRLQARAKNCRARWLAVMGFGATADDTRASGLEVHELTGPIAETIPLH